MDGRNAKRLRATMHGRYQRPHVMPPERQRDRRDGDEPGKGACPEHRWRQNLQAAPEMIGVVGQEATHVDEGGRLEHLLWGRQEVCAHGCVTWHCCLLAAHYLPHCEAD